MGLDAVNTKFCSFVLYFILFKEGLLEKHCCIVVFVKLKMFQQEDNREQDVSMIDSSTAKDIFFLNIEVPNFLAYGGFFAYICLFWCSKYEYLRYIMNFLFDIFFLFS